MSSAKRNRSIQKIGRGRGVPIRLARAVAKKYGLTSIVIFTADPQQRSRLLYWANTDLAGMQCAAFCQKAQTELGWDKPWDWDPASVRRLKERIRSLETDFARICEHEGSPVAIAKAALRLPPDV